MSLMKTVFAYITDSCIIGVGREEEEEGNYTGESQLEAKCKILLEQY